MKQIILSLKEESAYKAGFDAGKNGANTVNCHFAHFATPEQTRQWEKGNADGSHAREQARRPKAKP